ncbi:hypothetical protein MKleb_5836 (plasmid) [Klebsiella sp. PL-2018]|nr:hypothetical protein MKleb_5836 [Klebsiella sp. PL-2018]
MTKTQSGTSKTSSGRRQTVTIPISRLLNLRRTGSLLSTGTQAYLRTVLKPGDIVVPPDMNFYRLLSILQNLSNSSSRKTVHEAVPVQLFLLSEQSVSTFPGKYACKSRHSEK